MSDNSALDPKWGELSMLHDPYALANFQARSTDVLITTAPKAGTTWMQQILHQLRSGGDAGFFSIDEVVPWLEIPRTGKTWQAVLQSYEAIAEPRVFKTHCTYSQTPGVDVAKIVLTFRDPRDCCVSFYHHICDMTDHAREQNGVTKPASIGDMVEFWLDTKMWYRNVQSWWPHRDHPNVLLLRYCDLKQDLAGGLQQILDFLDWKLTESQWPKVLEYCSFEWMKVHANLFIPLGSDQVPVFKPDGFIRKGVVGDGKAALSVEQEKRVLDLAHEQLESECLAYLNL